MGFFRREKRASVREADDSAWWREVFDALLGLGRKTNAGITITDETALKAAAVFACVRVLSETVASLPRGIYRRLPDGGKEPAKEHPLYPLLTRKPNKFMTSFDLFEMSVGHQNLRGNFYSWIGTNGSGKIDQLLPLHPNYMTPKLKDNKLTYEYKPPQKSEEIFDPKEIWHCKFFSQDGIVGISPIHYAAEAIGLSMAAEKFSAETFSRKPVFSGVFKHPKTLQEPARKYLKESIQAFRDTKRQETLLLEEGLEWQAVGMNNEDAQLIDSRKFQIEEIARIFRVPCILIGHPDKTATYASAEQFFQSFIIHSIRPWLVRLEQSMNTSLLTEKEQDEYFIEFRADGLMRGDTLARYQAYGLAIQNKWMNKNEVRALENLNPVPDGDIFENPLITPGTLPAIGGQNADTKT